VSNSWTFTASVGDSLVVRAGLITGNLDPWVRLYGPGGTLLGGNADGTVGEVAVRATNSGTFTVVISDGSTYDNHTGDYRLTLAKTGSPIVVSPGDEGGPMTNGVMHTGAISVGDLDVWSFTAQAGEALVVRAGIITGSGNLYPWVRLYGPDGASLEVTPEAALSVKLPCAPPIAARSRWSLATAAPTWATPVITR